MSRYGWIMGCVFLTTWLCGVQTGKAWTLVNPAGTLKAGDVAVGGVYASTETEYDTSSRFRGETSEISRDVAGFYIAYGLLDRLDVFIGGGYILNAESDIDFGDSGGGMMGQWGLRALLIEEASFSINVVSALSYVSEDYGDYYYGYLSAPGFTSFTMSTQRSQEAPNTGKTETTIQEGMLGLYGSSQFGDIRGYAGVAFIGYEDADFKRGGVSAASYDRDSNVNGVIGFDYLPGNYWIRLEALLFGDTGFLAGFGMNF